MEMTQTAKAGPSYEEPVEGMGGADSTPSGAHIWDITDAKLPNYAEATAKFVVLGHESQLLEVSLTPGQQLRTEPGAMVYMTNGELMKIETGGCGDGCARCCCAGESFFRSVFRNKTSETQFIGISAAYPCKIIPVNMDEHPQGLVFKSGAFLAAYDANMKINYKSAGSVGAACCGGQGLFLNVLDCKGWAFLTAGGTVIERILKEGESLYCDTGSVIAFDPRLKYDIRKTGTCATMCCGGEGFFNTVLTGPGRVLIDTMDWAALLYRGGGGGGNGGGGGGGE